MIKILTKEIKNIKNTHNNGNNKENKDQYDQMDQKTKQIENYLIKYNDQVKREKQEIIKIIEEKLR